MKRNSFPWIRYCYFTTMPPKQRYCIATTKSAVFHGRAMPTKAVNQVSQGRCWRTPPACVEPEVAGISLSLVAAEKSTNRTRCSRSLFDPSFHNTTAKTLSKLPECHLARLRCWNLVRHSIHPANGSMPTFRRHQHDPNDSIQCLSRQFSRFHILCAALLHPWPAWIASALVGCQQEKRYDSYGG